MKNSFLPTPNWRSLMSLAVALLLSLFSSQRAQAQCGDDNTFFFATGVTCDIGLQTLTSCIFGGEYLLVSVTAGNTYTFETCGDSDFDTQITLYDDFGGGPYGYDDDFCGLQSQVTWVASFTGDLRVLVDAFFCVDEFTCMTLNASCTSGAGGPSNDLCADAIPLVCGSSIDGTTLGAGNDIDLGQAPNCGGSTGPGVWYTFVGNGQSTTLSICPGGADYDTRMAIYTGVCGGLACVVENDDFCGLSSEITLIPAVGVTHYVLMHGFGGQSGNFNLTFTTNCAPANDDCANATPIACGGSASGSTVMATPDGPGGCVGLGPNVWYTIVGTGGDITASLCVSSYDTQLAIFTGSCASPVSVVCNDDFCGLSSQVTWASTAGTNYLIMVDGFFGGSGDYTLNVTCAPVGPANDLCANAIPISCGSTTAGTTVGATLDAVPACGTAGTQTAGGVWYTFTGTGGSVTLSLCGSGYDTKLSVYDSTCTAPICVAGNDDFCGLQSQVTFSSISGRTYRVLVHGFSSATGPFTLTLTCAGTFPPNGSATVACPALAVPPVPPIVNDSECGGPITPTLIITNVPNPIICEGTRTYSYTYTGCAGVEGVWNFVYTIERLPFTVPANGAATVACPALAVAPTLPVVLSNCGEVLTPTGFLIFNNPSPLTCEGTRTYQYAYQDCEGNTATWSFVYTIERNPFTVPANTAVTVACPALIVQPLPPLVLSNCGEVLTPTLLITNAPNPLTCEGTRTFAYTYTDCELNSLTWSHVVTVERLPFTIVTPSGSALVACPDQTDAQPVPPVVLSNCGEVLTPVLFNVSPKPGCEGGRTYTFRYTDCEGNTADWTFTYTIEYLDFVVPTSVVGSVECPLNAFVPTPPTVFDNCGKLLTPVGPAVTSTTNAFGCEGSRKYGWTYTDCEGNTHPWSQTFLFLYSADFFVFPDIEDVVACLLYAQPPAPPTVYDICDQEMSVSGPTVTESISPTGCSGWRKFTFIYSDCGGHSHPWSQTYFINDDQAPLGTCPSGSAGGGPVAVNVTNIACIEDVPCPGDYDFTTKVEELLVAGNIFDVCSGDDLIVTLDSWTDLWQCSDDDGDGVYTFGRTFYFLIADQCGNEFPELCSVTYSGECLPLESFPQEAWGVTGGAPGTSVSAATTDLEVIQNLLSTGTLLVGGGNRTLKLTNAQCVVDLLPGLGGPGVLADCHQTNCTGPTGASCNPAGPDGMKNVLAANAIALTLNMRFNVTYNELTMAEVRNQDLGCIALHPCIFVCDEEGNCNLHVFDEAGTEYPFPYTMGGLLDLVNLFLGGNLNMTPGQAVIYGTGLNESLISVNAYWNEGTTPTSCEPGAGAAPVVDADKALPTGKGNTAKLVDFSLAPNPAGNEVTFKMAELAERQAVTFEIYNPLGQQLLRKEFGQVAYVNERIDLSGLGSGLYIVSVKAGGQRFEQKLVISKD